ncbi:MAG: hypothetical protein EBS32_04380 [Actinobacteria bacterium]|nr:hypothetical protein [Actinomycetota bacterium]
MPRTVIAQISDPHIVGPNDELFEASDPVGNLSKAIAHAVQRAEAVIITGDLAARAGTDAEYEGVRAVLDSCGVDVLLCAGNHDESLKIQSLFGVQGRNGRLDYVHELSQGRLVVLDSARAGRGDGALDDDQLSWLDAELSIGAFQGRNLMYRPGLPQYMTYTWVEGGAGFFARQVTVAPEADWLVMEAF